MNVADMVNNWETWADQDPMFSILTDPAKMNRGWDEKEFFATGDKQIEQKLKWLQEYGIPLHFGQALDFGSGLGRLSNALAKSFEKVHGVDISAGMVEQARKLSRYPEKITYIQNTRSDLQDFKDGAYDFIYTEIVLQHIPTKYQITYITDFMRLLSPKGVAFFQTLHGVRWRAWVPNWAAEAARKFKYKGKAYFPAYPISPNCVKAIIKSRGCHLLSYQSYPPTLASGRFWADVYVVAKSKPSVPGKGN